MQELGNGYRSLLIPEIVGSIGALTEDRNVSAKQQVY